MTNADNTKLWEVHIEQTHDIIFQNTKNPKFLIQVEKTLLDQLRLEERKTTVKLMIAQHNVTGKSYEDIVLQWSKEL